VEKILRTSQQSQGIDTTFYFEEKAAGRLLKLHLKVHEWVENHKLSFHMTSGSDVKSYSQWYTLERTLRGCRFTVIEDVTMPYGILGRIFGLARRPVSLGRLQTMLNKLRLLAETP
jgi:hypothetical protein